jgi:hypothetical protein
VAAGVNYEISQSALMAKKVKKSLAAVLATKKAAGLFSTLEIIFLHFVAKHLRHQDTKTQR